MRCDIIIPVWNNLEFTRDCVGHLVRNTNYPYRLILVDNGSDYPTKAYLEGLKGDRSLDVILIRNEENLGFVKAANQGLRASSGPYVCVMNNDTLPAPGWLERMVEFAEGHKEIGLINPQCGGHGDMPIDIYARTLEKNKGRYMEMNQCQGFCMLFGRALIDRIGLFDESFGIGGYDDTDYSMRAHLAGYRCAATGDSYVYHRLHGSFDRSGDREDWVRKNEKIYYGKWGKHLRVGVAVSSGNLDNDAMSRVVKFAYGLAREWSWVYIWINCGRDKRSIQRKVDEVMADNGLAPHQNIKLDYFNLPPSFFGLVLAGKLLERMRRRMRDKRFDSVVLFDGGFSRPISAAAKFVNADLVEIDLNEDVPDWLALGARTALSVKKGRRG